MSVIAEREYLALPAYKGEMDPEELRLVRVSSGCESADPGVPGDERTTGTVYVPPGGKILGQFLLPIGEEVSGEPDWYVYLPIGQVRGQELTIEMESGSSYAERVRQTDEMDTASAADSAADASDAAAAAAETRDFAAGAAHTAAAADAAEDFAVTGESADRRPERPQLHYTAPYGWINDPNGLIRVGDTWHLYHQHNPFSTNWGNMTWGHAVSRDLLHYEWRGDVMFPDGNGLMYSGCALRNEPGAFGLPKEAILYFYTASDDPTRIGRHIRAAQRLAYSLDGGQTIIKYEGWSIPFIEPGNRDPKVFRHAESGAYIMTLYLSGNRFAILRSENLENWAITQILEEPPMWECPDLVRLKPEAAPISKESYTAGCRDGRSKEGISSALPCSGAEPEEAGSKAANVPAPQMMEKWAFLSADGYYYIGSFDGYTFTKETPMQTLYSGMKPWLPYAAQSWTVGDGRVLSTAWLRIPNRGTDYTGAMSLPRELFLGVGEAGCDYYIRQKFSSEVETAGCIMFAPDGSAVVEDACIRETISPDGRNLAVEVM